MRSKPVAIPHVLALVARFVVTHGRVPVKNEDLEVGYVSD